VTLVLALDSILASAGTQTIDRADASLTPYRNSSARWRPPGHAPPSERNAPAANAPAPRRTATAWTVTAKPSTRTNHWQPGESAQRRDRLASAGAVQTRQRATRSRDGRLRGEGACRWTRASERRGQRDRGMGVW